jgi:hypothetical protein
MRGVRDDELVDTLLFGFGYAEQVFGKSANFNIDRIAGFPEGCTHLIWRLAADVGLKEHLHGKFAGLAAMA